MLIFMNSAVLVIYQSILEWWPNQSNWSADFRLFTEFNLKGLGAKFFYKRLGHRKYQRDHFLSKIVSINFVPSRFYVKSPLVNFITFNVRVFCRYFGTKSLQSQMLLEKSCSICFRMKNVHVKSWWNCNYKSISQFQQHSTNSFCDNFLLLNNLQTHTVRTKNTFVYKSCL